MQGEWGMDRFVKSPLERAMLISLAPSLVLWGLLAMLARWVEAG